MSKWIISGILAIGFLLRIIAIGSYPVGFTPDEASFGYDAYSILKTGKDQWGNSFPLVLKSFGDYKSPLYAYLTIPSVAAFGLTKEAVRLPGAMLGTMAIVSIWLLSSKLFGKKVGLISSLLLAISPWHIMMSRGAFEANLTTFFLPLGIWLFLQERFFFSGLIFGLNLFTYHSAKLVTPIIFLTLIIYSKENINFSIAVKKYWPGVLAFGIFILLTLYTFTIGAGARVRDINIFNGTLEEASDVRHLAQNSGLNPFIAKIVYNKYSFGLKRFLGNYVSYFSPQFLFTSGPAEATYGMTPGRGVLYWFELPLLLVSLVSLIKTKERWRHWLILGWILVAPIPAAFATGPGYAANRAVIMLPALQVLLALGFSEIPWQRFRALSYSYGIFSLVLFLLFLINYFFVSPGKNAQAMLYGNYEVSTWLAQNVDKEKIAVVDRNLSEPHIYVAFANKWDPSDYQKWTQGWRLGDSVKWVDQISEYRLGNYIFKTVHPQEYTKAKDIYLVSRKDAFSPSQDFLKVFKYPNGEPVIEIMKI